jgi:trans-aconitate methyltransferase
MQSVMKPFEAAMPDSHVQSLKAIETGYWWYQGRIYWAKKLVQRYANTATSYSDMGCGTGGFAASLCSEFHFQKKALVDGDPNVLKLAKDHPQFEIYQKDLDNFSLPFPPELVSCMDVLEHLKDDASFLKQLYEQMPRGGYFLFSVPAFSLLFSEWDKQLGHYRRYSKNQLTEKISMAGFQIKEINYAWSALFPVAFLRKFKTKRYQENMEFEPVPQWLNALMIFYSQFEFTLSRIIKLPLGTSLIGIARKPL